MTPAEAIKELKDNYKYEHNGPFKEAVDVLEQEIARLNDLVQGAIQEASDDSNSP